MGAPRTAASRRTRRRTQRGAAAVEFALVLPVFLTLVFGIISYGMMLSFRQSLSQAADEAARAAAVTLPDTSKLTSAQSAINGAMSDSGTTCTGTPGTYSASSAGSFTGTLTRNSTAVGTCRIAWGGCPAPNTTAWCLTVTLSYSYRANPVVPTVPGVGVVVPATLTYTSSARAS